MTELLSIFGRCSSRRLLIIVSFSILTLLILGTFIALFIVYFTRYRNSISSKLTYPEFTCTNYSCGCPNVNSTELLINSKIVGGDEAPPHLYPWLVILTDRYHVDPFCAGTIISSNMILTAAHCLTNRHWKQVQILTKAYDLRQFQGSRYDIDKWIIHPEYKITNNMHLNDIALIKIKQTFSNDLQSCCLPSTKSSIYPQSKTVSVVGGWGKVRVKPFSQSSPVLQHVVMPIVDSKNIKCRQSIIDSNRQLCAGYENLSIDTCSGDSGSPLLVVKQNENQGYFVVAGIVSYGNKQCDSSISSGVYTRVSFYIDWIESIIEI